jgi:hypothetical protein
VFGKRFRAVDRYQDMRCGDCVYEAWSHADFRVLRAAKLEEECTLQAQEAHVRPGRWFAGFGISCACRLWGECCLYLHVTFGRFPTMMQLPTSGTVSGVSLLCLGGMQASRPGARSGSGKNGVRGSVVRVVVCPYVAHLLPRCKMPSFLLSSRKNLVACREGLYVFV